MLMPSTKCHALCDVFVVSVVRFSSLNIRRVYTDTSDQSSPSQKG